VLSRGVVSLAALNLANFYSDGRVQAAGMLERELAWQPWQRLYCSSFHLNGNGDSGCVSHPTVGTVCMLTAAVAENCQARDLNLCCLYVPIAL
jgi:hypothetical protein